MFQSCNLPNSTFSAILEEVIIEFDQNINKVMLQKFLSCKTITPLIIDLLESEEWKIFEIAVVGIFTEKKDKDLLPIFLYSVGEFVNANDSNKNEIKETIVKACTKASMTQLQYTITILEEFIESSSLKDQVVQALFFEKLHISIKKIRIESFSV